MTRAGAPPCLSGNPVFAQLKALGLSDEDSVELFLPRVRDADDIAVLRCARSDVLFLSRIAPYDETYAQSGNNDTGDASLNRIAVGSGQTTAAVLTPKPDDDKRRRSAVLPKVCGKRWLDFGAGRGEMIAALGTAAATAVALEPNGALRQGIAAAGWQTAANVSALGPGDIFDVVTFFHVFEHLESPIETMQSLAPHLADDALLIFEVRHARDVLLRDLNCDAYRAFSLGKAHILLHTRMSLNAYLTAAGLRDITIAGRQRYPLSNHLYWLSAGKPGGHRVWSRLSTPDLDAAYERMLEDDDRTDTLWVSARYAP